MRWARQAVTEMARDLVELNLENGGEGGLSGELPETCIGQAARYAKMARPLRFPFPKSLISSG